MEKKAISYNPTTTSKIVFKKDSKLFHKINESSLDRLKANILKFLDDSPMLDFHLKMILIYCVFWFLTGYESAFFFELNDEVLITKKKKVFFRLGNALGLVGGFLALKNLGKKPSFYIFLFSYLALIFARFLIEINIKKVFYSFVYFEVILSFCFGLSLSIGFIVIYPLLDTISPKKLRGMINLSFFGLSSNFGILSRSWITKISQEDNGLSELAIPLSLTFLLFSTNRWLEISPRILLWEGKYKDAFENFKDLKEKIHYLKHDGLQNPKFNGSIYTSANDSKISFNINFHNEEKTKKSFREVFKNLLAADKKKFIYCSLLSVISSFYTFFYFSTVDIMRKKINYSGDIPSTEDVLDYISSEIILTYFVLYAITGSLYISFLIDTLSRKKYYLVIIIMMCLASVSLGIVLILPSKISVPSGAYILLLSIISLMFPLCSSNIFTVSEVYIYEEREIAFATLVGFSIMINLILECLDYFLIYCSVFIGTSFLLYGLILIFSLFLIAKFGINTTDKPLEDFASLEKQIIKNIKL